MLDGMEEVAKHQSVSAEGSPTGSTSPALWTDAFSNLVDSGCSTETEGSEQDDDFMAGLAEQMAHSMLDDSDDKTSGEVEFSTGLWEESWRTIQRRSSSSSSAAEASPLKPGWSSSCWSPGYRSSSSSSPPSTPGAVDDGWDVNAGFDEKSTSSAWRGQHAPHHLAEFQWPHASLHDSSSLSRKSSGGTLPVLTKPYAAAVNPHKAWRNKDEERHQIQAQQTRVSAQSTPDIWSRQQHVRCRQQQQESQQPSASRSSYRCGMIQRGSMAQPWQPIAPPNGNGSGMRAVFLGGSSDRSSSGTGVFLPRSTNDYTSKRKTTCSTVLLPSRIVQVLNLNVEDMRCQPLSHNSGNGPPMPPLSGSRWANSAAGEENLPSGQWKTYTTCTQLHQPSELRLPTEWSY